MSTRAKKIIPHCNRLLTGRFHHAGGGWRCRHRHPFSAPVSRACNLEQNMKSRWNSLMVGGCNVFGLALLALSATAGGSAVRAGDPSTLQSTVLGKIVSGLEQQVANLEASMAAFADSFTTRRIATQELCVADSSGAQTCITKAHPDPPPKGGGGGGGKTPEMLRGGGGLPPRRGGPGGGKAEARPPPPPRSHPPRGRRANPPRPSSRRTPNQRPSSRRSARRKTKKARLPPRGKPIWPRRSRRPSRPKRRRLQSVWNNITPSRPMRPAPTTGVDSGSSPGRMAPR